MKKVVVIIGLVFGSFLMAITDQELFLQANRAYRDGDYQKALVLYERLEHKTPTVWYNIGNASYYQEQMLEALVAYKRALKGADAQLYADCMHNMHAVYAALGLEVTPHRWYDISYTYADAAQLIVVLVLVLMLVWSLMPIGAAAYGVGMSLLMLSALTAGAVVGTRYWYEIHPQAVVIKPDCAIYPGTDIRFEVQTQLKAGDELSVLARKNEWAKVSCSTCTGWVMADSLAFV